MTDTLHTPGRDGPNGSQWLSASQWLEEKHLAALRHAKKCKDDGFYDLDRYNKALDLADEELAEDRKNAAAMELAAAFRGELLMRSGCSDDQCAQVHPPRTLAWAQKSRRRGNDESALARRQGRQGRQG